MADLWRQIVNLVSKKRGPTQAPNVRPHPKIRLRRDGTGNITPG